MSPVHSRIAKRSPVRASSGFSLFELAIGVAVLLMLVGSLVSALRTLKHGTTFESVDTDLQAQAESAMHAITATLKPSGFATVGGITYPYLFDDGDAVFPYDVSAHPAAAHTAVAGNPDFGANREIVFLQPADADADNRPDLDAGGNLVWSAAQWSFIVVTQPDGDTVLQRRSNGANPKVIAHHVERITFDDIDSVVQLPPRVVRVRIWFRKKDERGLLHRYFTEGLVKLRNG